MLRHPCLRIITLIFFVLPYLSCETEGSVKLEKEELAFEEARKELELSDSTEWAPEVATLKLSRIERNWGVVASAIKKRDFATAHHAGVAAYEESLGYSRAHGEKTLESGETLQSWHDRQTATLTNTIDREIDTILSDLRSHKIGAEGIWRFRGLLRNLNFQEQSDRFARESQKLGEERAKDAPQWVRIKFRFFQTGLEQMAGLDEFAPGICRAFSKRFPKDGGYRLVFGDALSSQENYYTWKTIEVTMLEDQAKYGDPSNGNISSVSLTLPKGATLRFKSTTKPNADGVKLASTWDNLAQVAVKGSPPSGVAMDQAPWNKEKYRDARIIRMGLAPELRKEIRAKLEAAIEKLPLFEVRQQ